MGACSRERHDPDFSGQHKLSGDKSAGYMVIQASLMQR